VAYALSMDPAYDQANQQVKQRNKTKESRAYKPAEQNPSFT
jgi:hypothetical protein